MSMPKDPLILLSAANTLLRDEYSSPEELCRARDWDITELYSALEGAGFSYDSEQNRFH